MKAQSLAFTTRLPLTLTLAVCLVVFLSAQVAKASDSSQSSGAKQTKPDVEIRVEFNPTFVFDLSKFAYVFVVIEENGKARVLRYGLRYQAQSVASYEGVLEETEVQRLFARVRAALRLPKYRPGYDRNLVYEDDGFYLGLRSHDGKVKERLGGLSAPPVEIHAIVTELSELWKRLVEVPPAYAYLSASPVEPDRLRRMKKQSLTNPTPIESLPADLQALLIPVVMDARNFYPLTRAQYERYQPYNRPLIYKGVGIEPWIHLSAGEPLPH